MQYDSVRHKVDCRLNDGLADTTSQPGYRIYPKPADFELPLDIGFTVAVGPGLQPRLINQLVVNTEICNPTPIQGRDRGRVRVRWAGWCKRAFESLKTFLEASAQYPPHFIAHFSNPKGPVAGLAGSKLATDANSSNASETTCVQENDANDHAPAAVSVSDFAATEETAAVLSLAHVTSDSAAADAAAADAAAASGTQCPDSVESTAVSSGFRPRRGVNDPEKITEPDDMGLEADGRPDYSRWKWYYHCCCAHVVNGCSASMVAGQRYDSPNSLCVRFYGQCVHKEGGKLVGRLSGSRRALVASRAIAMGNRPAHDLALREAPADHHLDGTVTRHGTSMAVIRKAASEARHKQAGLDKLNIKSDQLLQAMAVGQRLHDEDVASMADNPHNKQGYPAH